MNAYYCEKGTGYVTIALGQDEQTELIEYLEEAIEEYSNNDFINYFISILRSTKQMASGVQANGTDQTPAVPIDPLQATLNSLTSANPNWEVPRERFAFLDREDEDEEME